MIINQKRITNITKKNTKKNARVLQKFFRRLQIFLKENNTNKNMSNVGRE